MVSGSLVRGVVARGGRLGQARGCQRQVAGRKHLPGSSSADQPPSPHAPTSTDDVECCRPAMSAMWRVTSAKRWQWAESTRQWLGVRSISRRTQMGQRDSSAPRYIAHAAATQAPRTSKIKQEWRTRPKDRETSVDEPKRIQVGEAPPHRHILPQRPSPTTLAHYSRPLREEMATDALPHILPLCLQT